MKEEYWVPFPSQNAFDTEPCCPYHEHGKSTKSRTGLPQMPIVIDPRNRADTAIERLRMRYCASKRLTDLPPCEQQYRTHFAQSSATGIAAYHSNV